MDERIRYIAKIARNYEQYKRYNFKDNLLNATETMTLHYIRHNEGISQDKLVYLLGVDKGLVSRIVKRLIELNLIEKKTNELDKRENSLFSTESARKLKSTLIMFEESYYEDIMSSLDTKEKEEFLSLLEKIYLRSKAIRKGDKNES